MAKKMLTESAYLTWKKQYGSATGSKYVPILSIRQRASKGFRHRIAGYSSNRVHHLLSNLEFFAFLIQDWDQKVTDIRERFPLDIDETRRIADNLGLHHPYSKKHKEYLVLTTDLLVDLCDGGNLYQEALSIIPSQSLDNSKVLRETLIEKAYWEEREVEFKIYTEKSLPMQRALNIKWFWLERNRKNVPIESDRELLMLAKALKDRILTAHNKIIGDLCYEADQDLHLPPSTSIKVVKYMLANRCWQVDLDQPISSNRPLILII